MANNIDQLTLHYLISKGNFSLPLSDFLFHRLKLRQQKGLNCCLVDCLGTMKGPLFLLPCDSHISLKEQENLLRWKTLQQRDSTSAKVYKLLISKGRRGNPSGRKLDMSFCSPQPDLPQTLAQTQKTLCFKWLFTSVLVTLSSSWMTPCHLPPLSGRKPWILWSSKPVMFFTVTLRGCSLLGSLPTADYDFYYLASRKLSRSYGFM